MNFFDKIKCKYCGEEFIAFYPDGDRNKDFITNYASHAQSGPCKDAQDREEKINSILKNVKIRPTSK